MNSLSSEQLKSRVLGCLYGQALGDAWGMPAHLDIDTTWQAYGGWIEQFYPGPDGHPAHEGFPAARITDDSEQAFSLARAFIDAGGVTLEAAIEAIIDAAKTDKIGDGKIFVSDISQAIRIRTGETGDDAL